MCDARVILIALLLVTPFACSPDRGPASPTQGKAGSGSDEGPPPAPSTTNEPVVPGVPNALNGPSRVAKADTRLTAQSFAKSAEISQPAPGAGGTIGTGGTLGTGGTIGSGGTVGTGGTGGRGGMGIGGGIH